MGNEDYRRELIEPLIFLPNSPTLFNLDVPGSGTLSACFKFDVSDTMLDGHDGIMETATKAAMVTKWGGGVGYYLGNIRSKDSLVNSTHGKAMGPVALLKFYHALSSMLTQSGKRDAAQMGILPVTHPDILEFIQCKDKDPQGLSTFNISVSLSDNFMRRVVAKDPYAVNIMQLMAESAWRTGDPGVYFVDTAEKDNPTPWLGNLTGTNPCLTGDTKIHTVYEGAVSFKDLAARNIDVLVYAWNPETKLPVIRWMRKPRKTRSNVQILEVEFDNGLKVKCTPDHNFYTFRGQKIQAQYLEIGQSVRAFSMSQHRDGHLRVHGWAEDKAQHQWVAHMVWECFNGPVPADKIVHHINHNEADNRIENLMLLTAIEHNQEHYPKRVVNGFHHNETREAALARNHKVVAVRVLGTEDVYNGTVDDVHTYIIADENPKAGIASGIVSANCGEVPLLNNEPCNLGSINLGRFYDKKRLLNYDHLEKVTRLATRYLDDVLDRNHFPVVEISTAAFETRKLGLGVCGWADLIALAHIDYASQEAVDLLSNILSKIREWADDESYKIGLAKAAAPCFNGRTVKQYRNATRLCVAPTGTIALLMGASSGIEPHYLLSWTRTTAEGYVLTEHIPVLDQLEGFVPQTAMEIPWEWHIKHQAAAQKHVDLAVSKTINMPNSATVEDIYNAYIMMWQSGTKGGTVYRDGCRETQVLNAITTSQVAEGLEHTATELISAEERCPECGGPTKHEEQCTECVAGCGWSACSV